MIDIWHGGSNRSITISKRVRMLCIIASIALLAIVLPLNVGPYFNLIENTDENSIKMQNSTWKDDF